MKAIINALTFGSRDEWTLKPDEKQPGNLHSIRSASRELADTKTRDLTPSHRDHCLWHSQLNSCHSQAGAVNLRDKSLALAFVRNSIPLTHSLACVNLFGSWKPRKEENHYSGRSHNDHPAKIHGKPSNLTRRPHRHQKPLHRLLCLLNIDLPSRTSPPSWSHFQDCTFRLLVPYY